MHNANVKRATGVWKLFILCIDILYVNRKFNNYLLVELERSFTYLCHV